jgi:hypothetical protein
MERRETLTRSARPNPAQRRWRGRCDVPPFELELSTYWGAPRFWASGSWNFPGLWLSSAGVPMSRS